MSPSDSDPRAATIVTTPPYSAALEIAGGGWHSDLAHAGIIPLVHQEMYIGRLESCDVVLSDPAAGRMHAMVGWSPRGYFVQDLGAATGTELEGTRINGRAELLPGQTIGVGSTHITFRELALGAAPAPGTIDPGAAGASSARTVTSLNADAVRAAMQRGQAAQAVSTWIASQVPKQYWRVLLIGVLAYVVSLNVFISTSNLNLLPLVTLLASAVVPVAFVMFCWEQGALRGLSTSTVGLAFISGATLGLISAAVLEPALVVGEGLGAALTIGLCEETAKAFAVVWFLRNRRNASELDGLVLGAAAGMGFAALETAGYGSRYFINVLTTAARLGVGSDRALPFATSALSMVLNTRMELAVFGHGVWTAILCATIWRERDTTGAIRVTPNVVTAFCISVGLHTLWDATDSIIMQILYGIVGVLVLHFLINEAVARAKLGPDAPAPPALAGALAKHFLTLFQRGRRPVGDLIKAASSYTAATTAGSAAQPAAGPGGPADTQNCTRCGMPHALNDRFCAKCGTPTQ